MNWTISIEQFLTFNIIDLATLIIAVVGVWYAARQLQTNNKTALADFLVRLDERFSSETFRKIANDIENGNLAIDDDSLADVYNYLGAFEILKLLVDKKLLDIGTVHYMFGYYIIAAYKNSEMQKRINFESIYWREFKILAEKMIAYEQRELSKRTQK
ncbi:MAG: hypothetical protein HZC40_23265 [Chloroflexi bacterium]|nr:hypothetical protein [Chloroflexota bacterium]